MSETRISSVWLDQTKVRTHASELGISAQNAFETYYNNIFEGTGRGAAGAPEKAWKGTRMRPQFAQTIAELFGLSSYIPLLEDQGMPAWSQLVHTAEHHSPFMSFCLASDPDLGLFDLEEFHDPQKKALDEINIDERWHLKFKGKSGMTVMVIFQSQTEVFQLAPLSHELFSNLIQESRTLRYPLEGNIPFDKDHKLGWRRFTVIKSTYIPLSSKDVDTGYRIMPFELNSFALKLQQQKQVHFDIDHYEFKVVDTPTYRH